MISGDFPENQLTKNTVWTIKTFPGGGTTTFGGGTAISGGGTPNTGGGRSLRPVSAELNHWSCIKLPVVGSAAVSVSVISKFHTSF